MKTLNLNHIISTLASLKSVRTCAQTLIDTEDKIDILVNNAGKLKFHLSVNFSNNFRFSDMKWPLAKIYNGLCL